MQAAAGVEKPAKETVSTEAPVAKIVAKTSSDKAKPAKAVNTTAESLYEDAVSEPIKSNRDTIDNVSFVCHKIGVVFSIHDVFSSSLFHF